MKNLIMWLITICLLTLSLNNNELFAQVTIDEELDMPILTASQRGGLHITSWGTLKILVVFVKTKDDNDNSFSGWPLNSTPDWLLQFLDSQPNYTGQFTYNNYSQYFWEMSNGNFQVIGDIYPSVYISQKNEAEYANIQELNEEVLTAIDPYVDYSDYDNWRKDSNYNHTNVPDGNVDCIMIFYRALSHDFMWYTGSADLKLNNNLSFDGVTIKTGFPGSGLQQKSAMVGFEYTKYLAAHEIGHHLFGSGHTGPGAKLTLMDGGDYAAWYTMRGMCSWERERLGWIDYDEIQTTGSINVTLSDYMTTGDVIKINTGNTGEYFLLENRQGFSIHDQAADHGMYVLHVTNGDHSMATIDIECADGNWNFLFNGSTETLIRVTEIRNGKDEINFTTYYNGDRIICRQPYYPADDAWGDIEDAFSLDFNPLFSPWSNPSNNNSGTIDFSLKIFNEYNNLVQANINFSDTEAHEPFRPLNFSAYLQNVFPVLNWDINTEPDFNHYELWKKNSPTSDWEIYASVCTTNSINDLGNMYPDVFYKIRAVDNSNKKSVFTKEINVKPSVVSENTTWSGNFLINFDVTVNPGVTLTIANNSNLAFNSGKKLIVKGKLTAIGTSSNPIVFTSPNPYTPGPGDWQGIRFINGNSGSKLDYCNISYATNGIYVDNTDIEVKHSYIENNSNSGIMAVNGSDIFMQYNTVEDNYFGVYCQYDALGYLGDYYIKGGNRIDDHWIGLECNYDSYMFLGRSGWYPCDNSIYNTGYYRAIAMFGGDIKAEVTWWGTSSPSGSLFMANGYGGTIDYSPWLTYDPGYGSPLESIDKAGSTDKPLAPAVNKDDPASLFKGGEYFKGNKDYEKAGELWKLLIDRFPENEYAIKALVQLYHLDKNTEPTDVKAYLQNLRNKKALPVELTRKALILSSYSALHEDNLSSARSLVNEMHTNHEGTQAEVYGLYLQATMPEVGDASSAIKTLKTKYPDNILTIIAREIKGEDVNWREIENKPDREITTDFDNIPESYSLDDAYPNPFNPVTNIALKLPESGHVKLEVFNIRGQRVATLMNGYCEAGVHEFSFDGRNLASGVYFYRVTAPKFTAVKRMLLLK